MASPPADATLRMAPPYDMRAAANLRHHSQNVLYENCVLCEHGHIDSKKKAWPGTSQGYPLTCTINTSPADTPFSHQCMRGIHICCN